MVVEIFIPGREAHDPLGEHVPLLMDNGFRIARIMNQIVNTIKELQLLFDFSQEQKPRIGRHPPALKVGNKFLSLYG